MRPYLAVPGITKEVLKRHGFVFQKKYGQNFLIDSHVLEKIIDVSEISKEDFVLEIGPGIGTMTQYLSEAAGKVAAVEIDRFLIPVLEDTLTGFSNVEVIQSDILKMDLNRLVQEKNQGKPVKVVANLPYYITTPILMELLEQRIPISSITVMVQREVAERMCMGPGSKEYGALSLAVQYYSQPKVAAQVPPNCFIPRPKVGSSVVMLKIHEKPPINVENEELMFQIIRASFNQRRKTLVNGILNHQGLSFGKEEIVSALETCGIPANVRGESLGLEQFAKLADALSAQYY